ncbi:MAG: LLM class F420-dependent oxidoreductase [Pseudomonadota bacterium]
MQIGAVLPHNEIGTDPGAIKAYAQGVEAAGFSHMLLYDHVLGADRNRPGGFEGPYDKDTQFHEPLTTFAFIAAVTERIEMVTNVLVLPQRQTALVAKQAAQVAILSNNRLRLGVGTGWNQVEYEALDVPFAARGKRQEEQVALLRALWQEDSLDYTGDYHRVNLASINPRPSQPVPVWFGGGAPVLLDRAARVGDGWMPLGGPNEASRNMLTRLKEVREAHGLSWEGFGVQAQAMFAGGNPERWRTHAQRWRDLGATHIAVRSDSAQLDSVDAHLKAIVSYRDAVADILSEAE